jgi:hypothetical protein
VPDNLVRHVLRDAGRTRRRSRWLALFTERTMVRPPVVLVGSPTLHAASIALAVILAAVVGTLVLGEFRARVIVSRPNAPEPVRGRHNHCVEERPDVGLVDHGAQVQ